MEQNSLVAWLKPFTPLLWGTVVGLVCILPLVSVCIILGRKEVEPVVVGTRNVDEFIQGYFNQLFVVFANLLRQARGGRLVLLVMTLYGLVVVNQYEFYMTSDLVVPIKYAPFKTVEEFLDNGYKIKLWIGGWSDWINDLVSRRKGKRSTVADIFILSKESKWPVESSFKKEDPLFGVPAPDPGYLDRFVVNGVLKRKYKCYTFLWATEQYYYLWHSNLLDKAKQVSDRLVEFGIIQEWEEYDKIRQQRLDREYKNKINRTDSGTSLFISFANLQPWFLLLIVLNGVWVAAFLVEVSKSKGMTTVAIVYVVGKRFEVTLVKLCQNFVCVFGRRYETTSS